MKRLTKAFIRLYPRGWRQRYEAELTALIDDTGEGWQQRANLLSEALQMRITTLNWRLVAAFALAGLIIAGVISLRIPDRYLSQAVVEISSPVADIETLRNQAAVSVANLFSRTSLSNIIASPGLNLYAEDRGNKTTEAIVERMATRDARVLMTETPKGLALHVSFQSENPEQARATVQKLLGRLTAQEFSAEVKRDVLETAQSPQDPIFPNRPVILATGLLAGLLSVAVFGIVRRAPRTILLASLAVTVLTALASFVPVRYTARGTLLFASPDLRQTALNHLAAVHPATPIAIHRIGTLSLTVESSARVSRWNDFDKFRPSMAVGGALEILTSVPLQAAAEVTQWPITSKPAIPESLLPTVFAFNAVLTILSAAILLWDRRHSLTLQPA